MMGFKQRLKSVAIAAAPGLWIRRQERKRPTSSEIELNYLDRLVDPSMVAVDVGANMGLYTRVLARLARHVHAFEPLEEMASLVERTAPANVTLHRCALSDQPGSAQIHVPKAGDDLSFGIASLHREGLAVRDVETRETRLSTLDTEVGEEVGFVKIDVEGHELDTLKGAEQTIARSRPIFLVETEDRHRPGAPRAVFSFFAERDYEGVFLIGDEVRPVSAFDVAQHQNPDVLVGSGRKPGTYYINNFFFFPRERAENLKARLGGA